MTLEEDFTMTEPNDTTPTPAPTPDERLRNRYREGRGVDTGAMVWGAILLVVGLWFFLDNTLGIELPAIDWGDVWPVIVIAVGAILIFQGMRRRTG